MLIPGVWGSSSRLIAGARVVEVRRRPWMHVGMDAARLLQLRRRFRQLLNTGDESISVTGNGHDVIVLVGTLAECPSQGRDLARQIVLIDGGVRPDAVQRLIFADDVGSMFEEHDEHVERLRRDGHELTARHNLRLMGSTTNGPKAYPLPGRCFQPGIDHVALLPELSCQQLISCHRRRVSPGKSIGLFRLMNVLHRDTAIESGGAGSTGQIRAVKPSQYCPQ